MQVGNNCNAFQGLIDSTLLVEPQVLLEVHELLQSGDIAFYPNNSGMVESKASTKKLYFKTLVPAPRYSNYL